MIEPNALLDQLCAGGIGFFTVISKNQVFYTLPILAPLAALAAARPRLVWIGLAGGLWSFLSVGVGVLPGGRRFWVCFAREDISSLKQIALAESGSDPTLLESFLIDEKRITLPLLVSRLLQRLNGQKWLGRN